MCWPWGFRTKPDSPQKSELPPGKLDLGSEHTLCDFGSQLRPGLAGTYLESSAVTRIGEGLVEPSKRVWCLGFILLLSP
jgi:hypothetical protein